MPLRRPTLRRLVGAQFLSETGDGVVTVALPLYVLSMTDSAIAMSLTLTAQMLGGALLGVVGGVLADRFDRQTGRSRGRRDHRHAHRRGSLPHRMSARLIVHDDRQL